MKPSLRPSEEPADFDRPAYHGALTPAPTHAATTACSRRTWLAGLGATTLSSLLATRLGADEAPRDRAAAARPLGIFTHIVPGDHRAKARLVRAAGFSCVQWYPLLDKDELTDAHFRQVAAHYSGERVPIVAVAAYANIFDPRPDVRKAERDRLSLTLRLAPSSGSPVVCTETGTLNPLKADHPDNTKPEIWREFVDVVGAYLVEAGRYGSVLALEAYTKNVCRDARDVARLIAELGTAARPLRFVMDACNVIYESEVPHQRPALENFFQVISSRCAVAHAKDLTFEAGEKVTPRAGAGVFDWKSYAELLHRYLPATPLILEHLKWAELDQTLEFVRKNLRDADGAGASAL